MSLLKIIFCLIVLVAIVLGASTPQIQQEEDWWKEHSDELSSEEKEAHFQQVIDEYRSYMEGKE